MEKDIKESGKMTKCIPNVAKKRLIYDLWFKLFYDSIGKLFWNDRDKLKDISKITLWKGMKESSTLHENGCSNVFSQ